MFRYCSIFVLLFHVFIDAGAQRLVTADEAVNLALANQRNLRAASLSVQQQQQLMGSSAGLESPQLQFQLSPYDEGAQLGVQQTISLPGLYRHRKALQSERLRLAQLQLSGSQYDLKREVGLSFLQLQYLQERQRILRYQDSIYAAIKAASKRFFDAGQINKLEELQASSQADAVRNELIRMEADLAGERQIFRFFTGLADTFVVEGLASYAFLPTGDTSVSNVQQQILQQQIQVGQRELNVARAELLPELQAGVLFPTIADRKRAVGYQFGLTIPIWMRQNRSRIAAARTGIEIARAQQDLEQQRLNAQYRQALANLRRERQSLDYFTTTALPQARAIIEVSQRLFRGGELNYIESLRNLQAAFDIFFNHIDTNRAYNEAVIQARYLGGGL